MAYRSTILIVSAAVLVALAVAAPKIDLSGAVNNTICTIKVYDNKDINRIPVHIRELKCQSSAQATCCVELRDTVLVKYIDGGEAHLEVAVGCACMIKQSSPVETAT